jgi:hypothetical protein
LKKRSIATEAEHQGYASLVGIVNRIRHENMEQEISTLNSRMNDAMQTVSDTEASINEIITSNRGGVKGAHGFIGERVQVGFSNARSLMDGQEPEYSLIDDNGMTDYYRGSTCIQQKACQSDKVLGLTHVKNHAMKYPEFITEKDGIYQIPKDFYETFVRYRDMPSDVAGKLRNDQWRLWKRIQDFKAENPDMVIEPMVVDYKEIQLGDIDKTIAKERAALNRKYRKKKAEAVERGKASVSEGIKVAACSAAIEGVLSGGISVVQHCQDGKSITELDKSDWKEVGRDTLTGAGRGAVRGAGIYVLSNCAELSAPVAGVVVNATMSTADATIKYAKGEITGKECVEDIAEGCLQASICCAFAKAGEKIIRVPFVGSIIGGAVGMVVCGLISLPVKTAVASASKKTEPAAA